MYTATWVILMQIWQLSRKTWPYITVLLLCNICNSICLQESLKHGKKPERWFLQNLPQTAPVLAWLAQFVRPEWWGRWCVISWWSGHWCVWSPVWSDIGQLEERCHTSRQPDISTQDYFPSQPQFPRMLPEYKHSSLCPNLPLVSDSVTQSLTHSVPPQNLKWFVALL